MKRAYDEVIDFIAAGTTPTGVANFEASPSVKERAADFDPESEDCRSFLQVMFMNRQVVHNLEQLAENVANLAYSHSLI